MRFLDDGRICVTNNAAERALRGVVLGRKAWLFAGFDRGGERAAFMYGLTWPAGSPCIETRDDPSRARSMLERIGRALVGLKMPRALEFLGDTVRRIEHGQSTPLEAIEALLAEELTMRETRRIRTALVMARLSTVKALSGCDFAFQPSLDRSRILALAELGFVDWQRDGSLPRPARNGQKPLGYRARRRGRQGRPPRLLRHPRRHHRRPREGRARGRAAGADPVPLTARRS